MEQLEIVDAVVENDVTDSGSHCRGTAAVLGVGAVVGVLLWEGIIKPLWRRGKKAYEEYKNRIEETEDPVDKPTEDTKE